MSRVVSGLQWAKACSRPACIPKSRPRGKKAAGLRYERSLASALPWATHGQWFEFEDYKGHGWCQPDVFFELSGHIFVLEAKYTWTEAGFRQIEGLYAPVLRNAFRKPVHGVQVCKVLVPEMGGSQVYRSLTDACDGAAAGGKVVLHWIGAGLEPFRGTPAPSHLASGLSAL